MYFKLTWSDQKKTWIDENMGTNKKRRYLKNIMNIMKIFQKQTISLFYM